MSLKQRISWTKAKRGSMNNSASMRVRCTMCQWTPPWGVAAYQSLFTMRNQQMLWAVLSGWLLQNGGLLGQSTAL